MNLGWFDAKASTEFGQSLAHFFIARLPLDASGKKNKSLSKKKEILDKMFLQIEKFKQEHKLNVYKKARLGNAFKWTLRDAGYDSQFVDELTDMLMVRF